MATLEKLLGVSTGKEFLSFLLSQFSQGQSVVARVHLLGLVLRPPPVEVGDGVLQGAPLVLHALLLVRNAHLHLVKLGVQLKTRRIYVRVQK